MPTDVAEDSLELTIELLEATEPSGSSYPFPALQRTGRFEARTFRTITLENSYLCATLLPDLGGRIVRLFDKRTQTDVWPFDSKIPVLSTGSRGVDCRVGLQIVTGPQLRQNNMGTVATMPYYGPDDEGPTGVWWSEMCGDGLSINTCIILPPDRAALEIEVRTLNRTFQSVPYDGGLLIGNLEGALHAKPDGLLWHQEDQGIFIQSPDPLDFMTVEEQGLWLQRFGRRRSLFPRSLDTWQVTLSPYSGLPNLADASAAVATSFDGSTLRVQASEPHASCKIVLQNPEGGAMEAPADLYPEQTLEFPLTFSPAGVVVLGSDRSELLRTQPLGSPIVCQRGTDETGHPVTISAEMSEADLKRGGFDIGQRHLSHVLLGFKNLATGKFTEASHDFEQALLFNGEDHLTWWAKATAERLAGNSEEERGELLNAHFLAPLEPALRAESYLATPSASAEKAAILNPLEETPDAFIEVACLLLEANLFSDAAKWLDESLRHIDLPMLRYLLAYTYLAEPQMEIEIADLLAAAAKLGARPPYPWRVVEIRALNTLAARFPEDQALGHFHRLIQSHITS